MGEIYVIKANGEKELFSEDKLRASIKRAGIPDSYSSRLISQIKEVLYPEIPTSIIYKHITNFLYGIPHSSGKYMLKQAIMDFGPSGYPFEKYIARILSYRGYRTEVDVIMQGRCITHEVDIVAENEHGKYLIECKFHNLPGKRTDAKVALYIHSRYEDIMLGEYRHEKRENCKMWLVTNTKCTTDALSYAQCSGMTVYSWGYPTQTSLQHLIEDRKLYPVTCLSTLSKKQKDLLLSNDIVICQDLLHKKEILERLNLSHQERRKVLSETEELVG
ncbi:ATPase [Candidatus Gottesmanbacteria bacterium CG11_big_fil_rev_8_21_14_0_20_37_11]|uniref:ATPase n=1 Tax=Candidatus Gottesmanbacteria bacterium CG11_big_fil_rev_8_21_14_0_20_37_11 TaxID=1974575 RepID=A0A2H0NJE6_9BACT|nr:MAG: ATPase [Candidatus Gottesmanbacteria bacterium CG23_combo_of_CG06-09_8_20_14_all_37_19]PIR09003.1 MAG: ATPase [Candidatus Gottesmanbacteria bacterium CG11_big_fil_rev_8_21_14_0_20_37_11]